MLSGLEIKRQIELGNIVISDFNEKQLNPNSYNIKLGKKLKIYKKGTITPDSISEIINSELKSYFDNIKENYSDFITNPDKVLSDEENLKVKTLIEEYNQKKVDLEIKYLRDSALDPNKDNETIDIEIPEEGYVLLPGMLYLGTTEEYTETYGFIPNIDGRSTTGRLGIEIHRTAGFGDNGFKGKWTLEITVTHPVIVYAGMEIGQLYYEVIDGDSSMTYNGKYQNQSDTQAAKVDKRG